MQGGYDIWNMEDTFHFYYQEMTDDFDVVVHNSYLEHTDSYVKAGIMIRETLDSDAKNIMTRHVPSNDAVLQWRSVTFPRAGRARGSGRGLDAESTDGYEDGPGLVNDFEDGDLDEYVGAIGHYEVTTDEPVATGEYSLKSVSGGEAVVSSHVDLPRYPRAWDTFAAKVAATETTPVMGIAFGIKSHENFHFVRLWSKSNTLQFYRVTEDEGSTPEYTKLAESNPVDIEFGRIYEYVVNWGATVTSRLNCETQPVRR